MDYKPDPCTTSWQDPNFFQVHKEVYYMQGSLKAASPDQAKYAQLFFYDPEYASNICFCRNPTLDQMILKDLMQILEEVNPYIAIYCIAWERLAQSNNEKNTQVILNLWLELVVKADAD